MTTATTTATKISVSHLYKRYGSHQVIDDVSFDVQEGQVTLLAGPNGAGKSTLLRMICGLDTIDKGDITIMGRHYSQLSDPKHTIGALLDATWLDTALTAEQNLRVLADLAGIHRRRVANCLEMCGLHQRGRPQGFRLFTGHAPTLRHCCCPAGGPGATHPG